MYFIIYLSLSAALGGVYVNGLPNGAPSTACVTMTPLHGVSAQNGSSPHTITVGASATELSENAPITGKYSVKVGV